MINPRYTLDHGKSGFGWAIIAMIIIAGLLIYTIDSEEATNQAIHQCTEDNGIAVILILNDDRKGIGCIRQDVVLWGEK